jgi:hypothetical protein
MTIEEQVLATAAEWDRVVVGNDADEVGAFMTDDWVYVDSTGPVARADILGWIASGRLAHHSMRVDGEQRIARRGCRRTHGTQDQYGILGRYVVRRGRVDQPGLGGDARGLAVRVQPQDRRADEIGRRNVMWVCSRHIGRSAGVRCLFDEGKRKGTS